MNSQALAQNSLGLNLGSQSARRVGQTRGGYHGPRLLKTINAPSAIPGDNMPPKAAPKRPQGKTSPAKVELDEDIFRTPDSSDEEDNSADIKPTFFVPHSQKPPTTIPAWQARRDLGRQDPPKKGRGTLRKESDFSLASGQGKTEGSRANSESSKSSDTSKRKVQDNKVESNSPGRGMGDMFGRPQIKKLKKSKSYVRPKTAKTHSKQFISTLSDDENDALQKFVKPELDESPKKSTSQGFIMPKIDTPRKSNVDTGCSFKMPEGCSPAPIKRSVSPVEENSRFIMPEMDCDELFHTPSSHPSIVIPTLPDDTATMTVVKSPQTIEAILQGNDLGLGDTAIEEARKILAADAGALNVVQPTSMEVLGDEYFMTMTQIARCPMCNKDVDPADLRAFGYMNMKTQEKFCRSHRTKTAAQDWKDNNYPTIDWKKLDSRISEHHSFIRKLINGEESHYRSLLSERVNAGQDRTTMTMKTNLTPGYYGNRGLRIISENIMQKFTSLLKKRMVQDRLMSSRGFTPYVQAVLVPEVTVRLIMEDMKVDATEARDILADSAVVGELLNEEIRDVVRIEDSDESDD